MGETSGINIREKPRERGRHAAALENLGGIAAARAPERLNFLISTHGASNVAMSSF